MWCKYLVLVLLPTFGSSWAEEVKKSGDQSDFKRSLVKECENSYSVTCLKMDIVSWVDKLSEDESYSVIPGVTIVRENVSASDNNEKIVADLARDFPNDPDARLDSYLLKKVQGYLGSHSIKFNLFDKDGVTGRQSGLSGLTGSGGLTGPGSSKPYRNKKGGDNGLSMLLTAAALWKGTLFALALGGLGALAGKALMTGLISLVISGIIGIKSLTAGGGKTTTTEVVAQPVYLPSHPAPHEEYGHHSGWSRRSLDVPLPLGLQPGYKP